MLKVKHPECEICGMPSIYGVWDILEFDIPMQGRKSFEHDGEAHYFCDIHARSSVTTYGGERKPEEAPNANG